MHYHDTQSRTRAPVSSVPVAITLTKWLLLCAAACFGSIFAYNTLSPISVVLAAIVAVAVIGLNFAESYLVRFAVASWRFGFERLGFLAAAGALMIACYSLMAGYNVVESYLVKNQNSSLATDYDIAAAQQRIKAAKSESLNSFDFGNSQADFYATSAAENEKIAALLRGKSASSSSVNPSTAAGLISLALEVAIIGLTAFIELFIRPTPLPALVKFNDKLVDWGLNDEALQNLEIETSPSAGTVALPRHDEKPPERVRTQSGGLEVVLVDAYETWLKAVLAKEVKPTVKDSKSYLRSEHGYKIEDAQEKAVEYLDRAYNLGFLDLNDQKGAFSSQYVLANQKLLGVG